jgi:hypothetical protein
MDHTVPNLLAGDALSKKNTASYSEFTGTAGERLTTDSKIKQFIEDFGLWLKTHKRAVI